MRIGVMCSGNGTNFENIIKVCNKDEVVIMIHNEKNSKDEDTMIEMFQRCRVDLIVLAGYMRIIKNPNAFPAPMINIHPSLLPKYKGLDAVGQALESGDVITGCTVHYVTKELDSGQIIDQSVVPICPDDSIDTLTQRVQNAEYRLLPMVINNMAT